MVPSATLIRLGILPNHLICWMPPNSAFHFDPNLRLVNSKVQSRAITKHSLSNEWRPSTTMSTFASSVISQAQPQASSILESNS